MADDLQALIIDELREFFAPLVAASSSPRALAEVLAQTGWDSSFVPVAGSFQTLFSVVTTAMEAIEDPPETLGETIGLIQQIGSLIDTLRTLPDDIEGFLLGLDPPLDPANVAGDLAAYLVADYLERRVPVVYWALVVLDVIRQPGDSEPLRFDTNGKLVRAPVLSSRLDIEALGSLLRDPIAHLREAHVPTNGLQTAADARAMSDRLAPLLIPLLGHLGVLADYTRFPPEGLNPEQARRARSLLLRFGHFRSADPWLELAILAADEAGPALSVTPGGIVELSRVIGRWQLGLVVDAELPALIIRGDGIDTSGAGHLRIEGSAARLPKPGSKAAFAIGSRKSTRIEVGRAQLSAFLDTRSGGDFGFAVATDACALILDAGDGDALLAKLLPADGLRAEFDLGIGWSKRDGLQISGALGLEVDLPIGLSLGDFGKLETVHLGLRVDAERFAGHLAISATFRLGPIVATVQRIGLRASYEFGGPDPKGTQLAFLPPTGAGISLDAGGVVGGGYVEFDPDNHRYAGVLGLAFGEIGLTAIGLITTKDPSGKDLLSLLFSLGLEFEIQLSAGFVLLGVGGLIGINRTMLTDVLQKGLKSGILDSILFPDPATIVENAQQIIADMRSVFPVAEGRYVVGPMVKIGYGTPTMVSAEVGVFLTFPEPFGVALMGQVSAKLPTEDEPLIELNVDILGTFSQERKELTFQARIYDSRILTFAIHGDTAFLLRWGENPAFGLSFGGFHPNFQPPPPPHIFAGLQRLSIGMGSKDLSMHLRSYLAITPNSLQFGARFELSASGAGFTVSGFLGFDALFYFKPFSMDAHVGGAVALSYQGATFADIRLSFQLTGPTPWRARGSAVIKVLFFDVNIDFDHSWGPRQSITPAKIDPWPLVREALLEPRSWSSVGPPRGMRAQLRRGLLDSPEASLLVHPAGGLELRQRVAPLAVEISVFGNAAIKGTRKITIVRLESGKLSNGVFTPLASAAAHQPLYEHFAPAQFIWVPEVVKLALEDFELMQAGARFGGSSRVVVEGPVESEPLGYELIVIDEDDVIQPVAGVASLSWGLAAAQLEAGATRRALAAGDRRYAATAAPVLAIEEEHCVLVDADSLVRDVNLEPLSPMLARQRAAQLARSDPDFNLIVVRAHEQVA